MLAVSAPPGSTVGADKGYDVASFVDERLAPGVSECTEEI